VKRLRLPDAVHHTDRHRRQQYFPQSLLLTAHAQDVGQHLPGQSGDIGHVRATDVRPGRVAASRHVSLAAGTVNQPHRSASR